MWQVKEYRFDRFWAEYGKPKKLIRFWLFSGGRKFHKPIFTIKAFAIYLATLLAALGGIYFLLQLFYIGLLPNYSFLATGLVLIYLFMPLVVLFVAAIANVLTFLIKQLVYKLAKFRLGKAEKVTIIGITGSYGKSSTKEFLAQILSKKFRVKKTPENVNTEIGVAKYILQQIDPDDEIFIVEMGAYKTGEIKAICRIAKPKIGVITGINEQHLALFGSLENIINAKYELVECLPEDGLAVLNGENKYCLEMAEKWRGKKIIYKSDPNDPNKHPNDPNFPDYFLLNLSGAVEVAKHLGMSDADIGEAVKNIKLGDRMTKIYQGKNDVLVVEDVYSANPDGVLAGLDYLAKQSQKAKILVMPCLIELGEATEEIHKKIGQKIAQICDLAIITTDDCFEIIKQEAGDKAVLAVKPEKVIELLEDKLNSDTAVLLEGRLADEIMEFVRVE